MIKVNIRLAAAIPQLKAVYAGMGAPENWRLSRHRTGHQETPAMRRKILDFLSQKLPIATAKRKG
jgi:hypothetical protein